MDSLPVDLLARIALLLSARDVSALALCSRGCSYSFSCAAVWRAIYSRRRPNFPFLRDHSFGYADEALEGRVWRQMYTEASQEASEVAAAAVALLELQGPAKLSVECPSFHRAMAALHPLLSLEDVEETLLTKRTSPLINLLGIQFCICHLSIRGGQLREALERQHMSGRKLCMRWWVLGGRGQPGFRKRDDMRMVEVKLSQFTDDGDALGNEVAAVLRRGVQHEVMRIQIAADFASSAWVGRERHSQM
eukprot:TRINITY_DN1721_c0_g1_i1.p1 TRINITY_DN1721_c0_g1~~TRINITY_DN1721_c0_g1_i1.p1  ORF type:complete len:267 (-),score=43.48 TRINITY_DN1721_c0_g1_i1:335-1081(-)